MHESPLWWQRPTILVALGIIGVALALLWPYLGEFMQPDDHLGEALPASPLEYTSEVLSHPIDQATGISAPVAAVVQTFAIVYVSGEVIQPDVYAVPVDARVKDVVIAAGGLTSHADSTQINLAARIEDAQHIHIPSIAAHSVPAPIIPDSGSSTTTVSSATTRININTASQAELEELPGIGAALARRIIDHRNANGPFASTDDLQEVRGIGPTLFGSIVDAITTSP